MSEVAKESEEWLDEELGIKMPEAPTEAPVEQTNRRVSNEQLYAMLRGLISKIDDVQNDINELKKRTGFKDNPIGMPSRQNCNTDPGPWKKSESK